MGKHSIKERFLTASLEENSVWLFGRELENNAALGDAIKANPSAIHESLEQFMQVNWRQLLQRTKVPSLWIHGGKDPAISAPPIDLLKFLPNRGQYHVFQNASHYVMLHEPRIFNRLLADFLVLDVENGIEQLQVKEEWRRRVR
jgi:pimeloyl-ACP methyl ester carboxylesterase